MREFPPSGGSLKLARLLAKRAISLDLSVTSFILQQFDSPPIFFRALVA
jgi:hypothetical protein